MESRVHAVLRKKLSGLSTRKAAQATGLSHDTIAKILRGQAISLYTARKLSPFVGKSVAWLLGVEK